MILAELKPYLIQRRRADLTDLSARFEIDCDALRGMLQTWVARGRVRRLEASAITTKPAYYALRRVARRLEGCTTRPRAARCR